MWIYKLCRTGHSITARTLRYFGAQYCIDEISTSNFLQYFSYFFRLKNIPDAPWVHRSKRLNGRLRRNPREDYSDTQDTVDASSKAVRGPTHDSYASWGPYSTPHVYEYDWNDALSLIRPGPDDYHYNQWPHITTCNKIGSWDRTPVVGRIGVAEKGFK